MRDPFEIEYRRIRNLLLHHRSDLAHSDWRGPEVSLWRYLRLATTRYLEAELKRAGRGRPERQGDPLATVQPNRPLPRSIGSRIARPPGVHLRAFADAVFSTKTRRLVFEPTLRDLYDEYCEALKEGRVWKARWTRARGYGSFWSAVLAQLPVSLLKKLLDIWKAIS